MAEPIYTKTITIGGKKLILMDSRIPDITEEDTDKLLAVVNGEIVLIDNPEDGEIPENILTLENISELMGENLEYSGGKINVLTASAPEADNTRPITAAAVQETVGNINSLLNTI